jgi:hypothetical protein
MRSNSEHSFQRQQRVALIEILSFSAEMKIKQTCRLTLPRKRGTDQNNEMENSCFHWGPHAMAEDVIHDDCPSWSCCDAAGVL